MSVLVTGAGGFLGSALVERLLDRGESDVRCLVRRAPNDETRRWARRHPDARVEYVVGDLLDAKSLEGIGEGVDTVFHLAGAMRGSTADMTLNTVVGSKRLVEALVADGARRRVVLASSFAVYGTAGLAAGALVDEDTALEQHPERRGGYTYAKLRQETLLRELAARHGFELVVMRPGVVYGPGGAAFSHRVGVQVPGVFLHLGGANVLPLTYVDNCADAFIDAGRSESPDNDSYNVVDDDLVTSREYLRIYRREVRAIPFLPVPYPLLQGLSHAVAWYHRVSRGQLPAFFSPYKTATNWKGNTFSNARLKTLGWVQRVPTREGIGRTMAILRQETSS